MRRLLLPLVLILAPALHATEYHADLLIVGGTESGCAAAVQAARMGVKKIVLVNDIQWLGGQFSAEALGAIDENRGPAGYDQTVPFPRNGLFREVIDRIEALNLQKYGVARPGNTRVITTVRPIDAEKVFRDLLQPYVDRDQIRIISNYFPAQAIMEGNRLTGMRFQSAQPTVTNEVVTVHAGLTIDCSDWGDVIKLSGAAYEFGPDLKEKYGEPMAPVSRDDYPLTDMNPITYNVILEEGEMPGEPIPAPAGYDPANYRGTPYPSDPYWIYESRRLVDHYKFKQIQHPDLILLCHPIHDYPLDVLPARVAEKLEATEPGASTKNIVQMTRQQREIVFEDAKQHTLGYVHFLQTEGHEQLKEKEHSFRRFKLSEEFGTGDRMPPKPYVRESLRLKAMYMVRQQDTMGWHGNSLNFAQVMFHDTIACWQFEYDFHPTKRKFLSEGQTDGPWHGVFREGRRWGPPYSGKATFPLRALIPEEIDGLLGGQKNLGFTSLVSSAVRLHDQSMAVGQGAGAAAAVAILKGVQPREMPFNRELMGLIWEGLCRHEPSGGQPAALWPFADLDCTHPAFVSANQLAVRGLLALRPDQVTFKPDETDPEFVNEHAENIVDVREIIGLMKQDPMRTPEEVQEWTNALAEMERKSTFTRTEWAKMQFLTKVIGQGLLTKGPVWKRQWPKDADGDGIEDKLDPLPFVPGEESWPGVKLANDKDGIPAEAGDETRRFYFASKDAPIIEGFTRDIGAPFDPKEGFGWNADLTANSRVRKAAPGTVRNAFIFSQLGNIWETNAKDGKYRVVICLGDAEHPQPGQNVIVEGLMVANNVSTSAGEFLEISVETEVKDGRLSIGLGKPGTGTNTCLNWITIDPIHVP